MLIGPVTIQSDFVKNIVWCWSMPYHFVDNTFFIKWCWLMSCAGSHQVFWESLVRSSSSLIAVKGVSMLHWLSNLCFLINWNGRGNSVLLNCWRRRRYIDNVKIGLPFFAKTFSMHVTFPAPEQQLPGLNFLGIRVCVVEALVSFVLKLLNVSFSVLVLSIAWLRPHAS